MEMVEEQTHPFVATDMAADSRLILTIEKLAIRC
jgi:hypothetical protein